MPMERLAQTIVQVLGVHLYLRKSPMEGPVYESIHSAEPGVHVSTISQAGKVDQPEVNIVFALVDSYPPPVILMMTIC